VAGVLAKVGIGAWKQSINLERGGNIADPSEGSLSVVNTDKFWSLLFSNNINLSGCLCRIYEFSDTTGTIRAILNCLPTDSWDTATYNIPLQKASQKMLAAISAYTAPTVLPDGSNTSPFMPAIFGKLSHAKAILKNIDLSLFQNEQDGLFTVWPVSAKGRTTFYWGYQDFIGTYVIYIADYLTMNVSLGTVKAYFEGKAWVLFLTGSAKGVYRKIKTVVEVAENTGYIHVLFEQAFPAGNTPNGSAWCEIYLGDLENVLDTWPCLGSMSEDLSTPMLSNYPAFLYNNNAYSNITGQIISSFIDSGKNSFRPDLSTATNDYKTFTKTDIIPLMNLRLCPEFLEWGFPLVAHGGDTWYQMKSIGLVRSVNPTFFSNFTVPTLSNMERTSDKDFNTDLQITVDFEHGAMADQALFCIGIEFDFPNLGSENNFDTTYLAIKASVKQELLVGSSGTDAFQHVFQTRGMGWYVNAGYEIYFTKTTDATLSLVVPYENIPDKYYAVNTPDTGNVAFYTGNVFNLSSIGSVQLYKTRTKGLLVFGIRANGAIVNGCTRRLTITLNELGIMFTSQNTVDNIYLSFAGRIFNDTWATRKTATALIQNPPDLLETINRLQNWSELSPLPEEANWGLGYASGALIKTSGDGSFDSTDPEYAILKSGTYLAAREILDESSSHTDELKRSLCRNFGMASWIDQLGYECVCRINKYSDTTGLDTVVLSDIIDRTKIVVNGPKITNIFCEPYIRYQYNYGADTFDKVIQVEYVSALTYDPSYIIGLTGTSAESLWTRCHALYEKYHIIQLPPSDMVDLLWYDNSDTNDTMAFNYLSDWIDWMGASTISFPLHYLKAGSWSLCKKIVVTLPHQTNNIALRCFIVNITPNPNPPYTVDITALTFDTIPADFSIQDSMTAFGNDSDWQDSMTVFGNNQDKQDTY
jgi:hypothetical protein